MTAIGILLALLSAGLIWAGVTNRSLLDEIANGLGAGAGAFGGKR